jgi:hypothetical protein
MSPGSAAFAADDTERYELLNHQGFAGVAGSAAGRAALQIGLGHARAFAFALVGGNEFDARLEDRLLHGNDGA